MVRLVGCFLLEESFFHGNLGKGKLFMLEQLGSTVKILSENNSLSIRSILPLLVLWFKIYAALKKNPVNSKILHVSKTSSIVLCPNLLETENYFH